MSGLSYSTQDLSLWGMDSLVVMLTFSCSVPHGILNVNPFIARQILNHWTIRKATNKPPNIDELLCSLYLASGGFLAPLP